VIWYKSGEPESIADATITPLYKDGQIKLNTAANCRVAHDPINHRFLYTLETVTSSTFATGKWTVAPYSLRLKAWEALAWDLGTVYSFATGKSSTGEYRVFFGGPNKHVYELTDVAKTDAGQNATGVDCYFPILTSSTAAVTFTSANAIPVSAYSAYAKIIDKTTLVVTRTTGTVSGATSAKTFTFGSALATAPTVGSTITFDLPIVELETRAFTGEVPHDKKRYLFTYVRYASTGDTPAWVGIRINNLQTPARVWQPTMTASGSETFGTVPSVISGAEAQFAGRVAKVGEEAQLVFVGYYPAALWYLTSLAVGYTVHYVR
jgi:hypothetical protein